MDSVFLKIFNRNGSVQHYYHYLLGFLMPLCINWDRIQSENQDSNIIVRSCALMDRITNEFNFKNLSIVEYDPSWSDIYNAPPAFTYHRTIELDGYDFPKYYDIDAFKQFNDVVCARLDINNQHINYGNIVLIDRLPPDPFYTSDKSEYRAASAGTFRRSIPNIPEIKKCADGILGNTSIVALENLSLASQIQLFKSADIIIAQHGASLANLIWARPGTTVIEILPKQMAGLISVFDFFGDLCRFLDLKHKIILQDGYHAAVDIDLLSNELKKFI